MVDLNRPAADERWALGGRLLHIAVVVIAFAGSLALNWNWLTGLGLAPLLLTILPCVAMCALGLCMSHGNGSRSNDPAALPTGKAANPMAESTCHKRGD